jgi:hypothetical protein
MFAFGICLYSIPARKGYLAIPEASWGEFSLKAFNLLNNKDDEIYIKTLTDLNNKVDKANHHNLETNNSRSKWLRLTFWILLISLITSILGGLTGIADFSIDLKINKMEHKMTNNKSTSDIPAPAGPITSAPNQTTATPSASTTSNQPSSIPQPAGPIGSNTPNTTTHSAHNEANSRVRLTESKDHKEK